LEEINLGSYREEAIEGKEGRQRYRGPCCGEKQKKSLHCGFQKGARKRADAKEEKLRPPRKKKSNSKTGGKRPALRNPSASK